MEFVVHSPDPALPIILIPDEFEFGRELSLGQFAHRELPGRDGLAVPNLPTPLAPPVADEHVPPLVPGVRFF
jgi:hypothetical protein